MLSVPRDIETRTELLRSYLDDFIGKELLYLELNEVKILKTRGKETVKAN